MHKIISIVVFALVAWDACAQSLITAEDQPGSRNLHVVYYDEDFLFVSRNYGSARDQHGNTDPGFFVQSKAHGRWLRILRVSTKDGKFGKSMSDVPEERKRMKGSAVSWDFTSYTNKPWIEIPLTTSGFIAFPEDVVLDLVSDRYKMSFFTSWKVESAITRIYVNRSDLVDKFSKFPKLPDASISPAAADLQNRIDQRLKSQLEFEVHRTDRQLYSEEWRDGFGKRSASLPVSKYIFVSRKGIAYYVIFAFALNAEDAHRTLDDYSSVIAMHTKPPADKGGADKLIAFGDLHVAGTWHNVFAAVVSRSKKADTKEMASLLEAIGESMTRTNSN